LWIVPSASRFRLAQQVPSSARAVPHV